MKFHSLLLIIGIISLSAHAEYTPPPAQRVTGTASQTPIPQATVPTTQVPQAVPQQQVQTPQQVAPQQAQVQAQPPSPADVVKQHTDFITSLVKSLTPCDRTTNPAGCHLEPVKNFMDFAIYFQFCPQLKGWDVSYTVTTNIILTLSQTATGHCQISVNYGSLNFPPKSCVLTPQQAATVSSLQTLFALYEHDTGQYKGGDIGIYIQPIVDCFQSTTPSITTGAPAQTTQAPQSQ